LKYRPIDESQRQEIDKIVKVKKYSYLFSTFIPELRRSKSRKRKSRDRKHLKNHLASKCFKLVLFGRSKFDEIAEFVEFKTSNDKMRKFDDGESDEKYSRPKIEQSLRPDFHHSAAPIRDEERSWF
jgi:hypothetical protein